MPKIYTKVGFGVCSETSTDVWTYAITEKYYYGELTQPISRWSVGDKVNDDQTVNGTISIVTDPFATENWRQIKYIEFMGTNWKVTSVEIQYPRLILSLGGEYNDG